MGSKEGGTEVELLEGWEGGGGRVDGVREGGTEVELGGEREGGRDEGKGQEREGMVRKCQRLLLLECSYADTCVHVYTTT